MFLRTDPGFELAGGTTARGFGRADIPGSPTGLRTLGDRTRAIDWVPDLGTQIGGRDWWRGLATCTALCTATWALSPSLNRPIPASVPAPLTAAEWDEARAQGIAPLAWGGDTGRRMAANDLVRPLAEAPERPSVDLTATLGDGDALDRALVRAGVGRPDAQAAARLVAQAVPLDDLATGTRIAVTLGRRADKRVARPLETLSLRARFDLALTLGRTANGLAMTRQPIAVDNTPLRLQGLVGSSLYRSVRAAGAPARAVEAFIKAIATRMSVGRDIAAADSFDLVIARARAATGETRIGDLLFAGIDQGSKKVQLVRWSGDDDGDSRDGKASWFDAAGTGERRGFMGMPVAGHITSTFGWRMHPILGFMKLHKGVDIGAAYGSPIYAVTDGTVSFAGRAGGYGNFVKLAHAGGLETGYGHMSRMAVSRGAHVARGQVIGYVGSTGMSTGPHLHWEVWRGGVSIDPRRLSFDSVAQLTGAQLRAFKAHVAGLLAVKPGA